MSRKLYSDHVMTGFLTLCELLNEMILEEKHKDHPVVHNTYWILDLLWIVDGQLEDLKLIYRKLIIPCCKGEKQQIVFIGTVNAESSPF